MGLFSWLFARTPAQHESGYGPVYSAVVARLTRPGVTVGRTARPPRVEVHSITEGERLDKEGQVRQLTLTVESIGNTSLVATAQVNEANIERLTSELVLPTGWTCLGVVPDQLQDLTESSDTNKIVYRLLQTFTVWVMRIKADTSPTVEPDPGDIEEPDPDEPIPVDPDEPIPAEPEDPLPAEPDEGAAEEEN